MTLKRWSTVGPNPDRIVSLVLKSNGWRCIGTCCLPHDTTTSMFRFHAFLRVNRQRSRIRSYNYRRIGSRMEYVLSTAQGSLIQSLAHVPRSVYHNPGHKMILILCISVDGHTEVRRPQSGGGSTFFPMSRGGFPVLYRRSHPVSQ